MIGSVVADIELEVVADAELEVVTIILTLSAAEIIWARAVQMLVVITQTKANSSPSHCAELIRQGKHSRQKQRISVVVFSELVATDVTSVLYICVTDLSQQSYGSATTAPVSYSDATTFKSSAGIYISYTPVLWYIIHIHLSAVV